MKNSMRANVPHDNLWTMLGQLVQSEQYQSAKTAMQKMPHPSPEMLYDYVLDGLSREDAQKIRTHLVYCAECADEVTAIVRIETEAQQEEEERNEVDMPMTFEPLKPILEFREPLLQNLALEFWEPRYAGMELTGADMPKQTCQFQEGQIKISTYWEGERGGKLAYIWIAWEVSVPKPYHLIIKFFQPETEKLLYEINLGTTQQGEETFTSDDLHFDPTMIRWAMAAFTKPL